MRIGQWAEAGRNLRNIIEIALNKPVVEIYTLKNIASDGLHTAWRNQDLEDKKICLSLGIIFVTHFAFKQECLAQFVYITVHSIHLNLLLAIASLISSAFAVASLFLRSVLFYV